MSTHARTWSIGFVLALCTASAMATSGDVIAELPGAPSVDERLEQLGGNLEAAYDAVLADFDALAKQAPYDVAQQVARCEFMGDFASTYEYASFIDKVYDQQQACGVDPGQQPTEQLERRGIAPVEVLHQQHQRLPCGDLDGPGRQDLQGPAALEVRAHRERRVVGDGVERASNGRGGPARCRSRACQTGDRRPSGRTRPDCED